MKIEAGKRYRLRNGAIVQIFSKRRMDGTKFWFWIGKQESTGNGYTCQEDGSYAPDCGLHPHELDAVEAL